MSTKTKKSAAKKPAVSRKIKKVAAKTTRKSVSASSATAIAAKANADKTAQPGVISGIITVLGTAKTQKKMLTVAEITQELVKMFPERPEAGMTTTVRAQLSRLPRERDFVITKTRDGREMRYAAA